MRSWYNFTKEGPGPQVYLVIVSWNSGGFEGFIVEGLTKDLENLPGGGRIGLYEAVFVDFLLVLTFTTTGSTMWMTVL